MVNEGRKFGLTPTFIHVERFGQLANNQKLMGATAAIVNKMFFQTIVRDAEEFVPEIAKRVEPTEIRREAELVLSPNPVEDIGDRGHPQADIMWLRGRYFWLVELLRNYPNKKYLVFDPSWTSPDYRKFNPLEFRMQDFTDWDYYRSSTDMIRQAISLWNQFLFDWMRGKYDPNEAITDEQVEITIKMIECLGGVLGFIPMLRPHIPQEKHQRLIYLMNEKLNQEHDRNVRNKVQAAKAEIQSIDLYGSGRPIPIFSERQIPGDCDSISYNFQGGVSRYWPKGTSALYEKEEKRKEELNGQILSLEQSQPSRLTGMPSSINSLKDIEKIQSIAIQAGMPTHEVEEFIEWELNPFTDEEKDGLAKYVRFADRMTHYIIKNRVDGNKKYWDENPQAISQFLVASKKRYDRSDLPAQTRNTHSYWQNHELFNFISLFLGDNPHILAQDPIKIPSGKYTETLRVERTQQDLNNEMVNELTNLPRFQAYAKVSQEGNNQAAINKMDTYALPDEISPDREEQAIKNAHNLCKTREDIDAEIRERQSRWTRGTTPPPQAKTGSVISRK